MKTLRAVLIITLIFPCLSVADVVVPVDEVESYVNIRGAPNGSAEVVGRLQQGSSLPHVGTQDGWHEVGLGDGSTGFLSADWTVVETSPVANDDGAVITPVLDDGPASVEELVPMDKLQEVAADIPDMAVEDSLVQDEVVEVEPVESVPSIADSQLEGEVAGQVEVLPSDAETSNIETVGRMGLPGPQGPAGPPGPSGAAGFEGKPNYVVKFAKPTVAGESQIYDNGRRVGIGTEEPQQRLEINGNIQIHASTSNVAGLMITQSSGETGYIMHNRASTLTIGAGSVDRMTIDGAGNVGIGKTRPEHPMDMASGAHVSRGGVWTNSSSIANKENIESLTVDEALSALSVLEPVHFNYKNDPGERHVGFIAENVPELVATSDRKGLSPMDVVAVLTRVVQLQQTRIDELESRLESR